MAAMAFFFLMVVIFFSALFFIMLNVIFIIIWNARKRMGKAPKKRYIVIPIVFLVISLIVEVIPIGWVGMVRSANGSASKDIIMAESGKIVYWDLNESGSDTVDSFEMDGIDYIDLGCGGSTDTWKLGKPVANLRYKSDEKGFNKFMNFLFAYDSTSTLYPIFNEKGFKLYTIGSNIYCPENQKDLVLAYYNNLSNYDTQNCRYGYGKYLADKVAVDGKKKFDYIYKNVTIDQGIFEKLYHISDRQEPEAIKIPEKYINIRNAEKPGASIFGYDDRQLYAYSKDRVMSKDIELDLIDGQVYYVIESGNGYIKGYRLVHEINENLKETIFRDR